MLEKVYLSHGMPLNTATIQFPHAPPRELPDATHLVARYLQGRGSDWPVCTTAATYAQVKAIAERLVETQPERAARFFELNAIDAYNLR